MDSAANNNRVMTTDDSGHLFEDPCPGYYEVMNNRCNNLGNSEGLPTYEEALAMENSVHV